MPLADELVNAQSIEKLSSVIRRAAPSTGTSALDAVPATMADLGLRDRTHAVKDAFLSDVGGTFWDVDALLRACLADEELTGWMIWPLTEAVAASALADGTPEAFDAGLDLLAALTGRLSSEFGIRPMLARDLPRALPTVLGWTDHPDWAVRRLASEGTRRYLPWGSQVPGLMADASITLPILDALVHDPSEDVRRSVANHLNDLSRTDPDLVMETAQRWLTRPDTASTTPALVKHALRTLVKKGDPRALAVLGFEATPHVRAEAPVLSSPVVHVGEDMTFEASIHNDGDVPAKVAVDYVVHHLKANGTQTTKVFKLKTATIGPGQVLRVTKKHSFKVITTRRYHPGEHAVSIQVNGNAGSPTVFELAAPAEG